MTKTEALNLLGGVNRAAELIGVTPPAIYQWPDELTPRLADRVQAALWRLQQQGNRKVVAKATAPAAAEWSRQVLQREIDTITRPTSRSIGADSAKPSKPKSERR